MRGIGLDEEVDPSREAWLERIHPDDRQRIIEEAGRQNSGELVQNSFEYRERHRDGHYMWILSRGRPVEWMPDGSVARIIGTDTDITSIKQDEARIAEEKEQTYRRHVAALEKAHEAAEAAQSLAQSLARHDVLTGLPNRRVFGEALEAAGCRHDRGGAPVCNSDHRPRPVQAGQRRPRSSGRRSRPARSRDADRRGRQRRRHGGASRRRRVRRHHYIAPLRRGPRRRCRPARRPDHRQRRTADQYRRSICRDRCEHRHRHLPAGRDRSGDAPPRRRHGDVSGQGRRRGLVSLLPAEHGGGASGAPRRWRRMSERPSRRRKSSRIINR